MMCYVVWGLNERILHLESSCTLALLRIPSADPAPAQPPLAAALL